MFRRKLLSGFGAPLVLAVAPACSLKTMAVKSVAGTLSETGDVFTRDDDPDLVRDASPFALKLYESLLESVPNHVPLLTSTCGAFTQNGYAFLESEADAVEPKDRDEAAHLRERALKHYLRGRKILSARAGREVRQGDEREALAGPGRRDRQGGAERRRAALLVGGFLGFGHRARHRQARDRRRFSVGAGPGRSRAGPGRHLEQRAPSTSC